MTLAKHKSVSADACGPAGTSSARNIGARARAVGAGLLSRFCRATKGRWRSGVTAMETALIIPPFLLLAFGITEVSILFLAASTLEGQVALASRQIRTGNIQSSGDPLVDFQALLCDGQTFITCDKLINDVRNFESFGEVDYPDYFDDDGEADNNEFDPGGAGDTVLVRVAYRWQILTPFLAPYLGDGGNNKLLHAAAIFRTEPYDGVID